MRSFRDLIHMLFDERGPKPWLYSIVYVNLSGQIKQDCFVEIKDLIQSISLPWIVVGDFNKVLLASEERRLSS